MGFTKDTKTAIVSRLWTTTDAWYKKSWYTATWKSYLWHLKPIAIKYLVDINNFWKEFEFHTEYSADIKESDKVKIDNIDYDVKGVSLFDWISFSRLVCILQKW